MGKQCQCWLWGGASHLGGRKEQQDRWSVYITPEKDGLLAVIADGLGGHCDGALAAQAVIDAAKEFIHVDLEILRVRPQEAVLLLCERAQTAVAAVSARAHSTMVALWLYQDQAYWMHIGDSRFYHLRAGRRLVRTRDHSTAQMLMELGEISEAEIANHPDQNRLYRCLGGGQPAKPEIGSGSVSTGDLLVLCSDGLWEHVSEAELWASTYSRQLKVMARTLVERAASRGGPQADNATLVLVRLRPQETRGWSWVRYLRPS